MRRQIVALVERGVAAEEVHAPVVCARVPASVVVSAELLVQHVRAAGVRVAWENPEGASREKRIHAIGWVGGPAYLEKRLAIFIGRFGDGAREPLLVLAVVAHKHVHL